MAEGTTPPLPEDKNSPSPGEETKPNPQMSRLSSTPIASNRHATSNVPRVTPFPVSKDASQPILPKLKSASASDRRQASNPQFTLDLLQEIQQLVTNWQQELQNLHREIEELYREGPMIDGWLESQSRQSPSDRPITSLRHADIEQLMVYIEEIAQQEADPNNCGLVSYQLCGLDEQGNLWSKPCPSEQIPSVSIAIARYQKVKQLLKRKIILEQKITQLAENLIVCCTNLQERG